MKKASYSRSGCKANFTWTGFPCESCLLHYDVSFSYWNLEKIALRDVPSMAVPKKLQLPDTAQLGSQLFSEPQT
jgi:hypothetical protein